MMFCPKCGSLLLPKKEKEKTIFVCSCGYNIKNKEQVSIKEQVKKKSADIQVAKDEEQMMPETDAQCPKCDSKKAYFWLVQTRAGDEPETKFLKCVKCKHTWRDYS